MCESTNQPLTEIGQCHIICSPLQFSPLHTHSYTYSVDFASTVDSTYCHDSSVTSLCWKGNTLATASWDSTVKVGDVAGEGLGEVRGVVGEVQRLCYRVVYH